MISLPNLTAKMTMTSEQLDDLKSNYCEMIIDGMDMDSLVQMCFDLLMNEYEKCSEEDIKQEILDLYDEETLNDLMEEVK